jgi:hypothetical protein
VAVHRASSFVLPNPKEEANLVANGEKKNGNRKKKNGKKKNGNRKKKNGKKKAGRRKLRQGSAATLASHSFDVLHPHRCPHGQKKQFICRQIAFSDPEMMTEDAKFALGF